MKLSLRQLDVLVAVARSGSVTRAAEALAMSQSAASAALMELERQHAVQLFDRVGKRLQLNDLGKAVVPRAAELLDRAHELEDVLAAREVAGDLRVGATLTIGNYLGAQLVSDFMRRYPQSRASLAVENTARVLAGVLDFELDLGLVEGRVQHPDLEAQHWRDDELAVFASASHPLARRQRLTIADLAAADWILREPGSGTRDTFDRATAGVLPELRVKLTLSHTEAILHAVGSGLGLGCVSRIALQEAFARGGLVPLQTPFLDLRRAFLIVQHRRKYQSLACRRFIEMCWSG
ncbi:MAG TPA: LysR family transcriptional regulator [Steroidobacteraceae bacterium]|nr:LysR family transcriptional regulator [Steroidobacteraceae bacterium]